MAQQEEPLYDFPEPNALSERRRLGLQRGRGSLKSINILDRLLLTGPVWLQLTINPATALHILQREPPGTFMVRKSRTSQKNVLCVRLADDSMPSFVQQFGIREEHSTLSLETSAISFPDLPRLISFYCVSRDVLPFPLELPEAIAKATSHKELESISHMGIEFWNSHLNVRGPREAPRPQKDEMKKPDIVNPVLPVAAPQASCDSAPQLDSDKQLKTVSESGAAKKQPASSSTVFQTFCPITTRSPKELDFGSGLGALCFINPLFLQSQDSLSRRRMFQRSVKIRVSTETSTMLSPPLAPPPPPPLMPKTKGRCKVQKQGQETTNTSKEPCLFQCKNPSHVTQIYPTSQDQPQLLTQTQNTPSDDPMQLPSGPRNFKPQVEEHGHMEPGPTQAADKGGKVISQLPTVTEYLQEDSEYKVPSPVISSSNSPSLSPYLCPSVPPMAPPLLPKSSPSLSPHNSPGVSPSLSPRQSPALSPKVPFALSPSTSPSSPQLEEQLYNTPAIHSRLGQQKSERDAEEEGVGRDEPKGEDGETNKGLQEKTEPGEKDLVSQMNAACLNNSKLCNSIT